jgi:uncharacterized protein (TIGR00297 family)
MIANDYYVMLLIKSLVVILSGIFTYRKRWLTKSGVHGFIIVSISVLFGGNFLWFFVLIAFAVSASVWSEYYFSKKEFLKDIVAKIGPRDFWQVIANTGLAGMIALLYSTTNHPNHYYIYFLSSIAAVNADTWATEIGSLSKKNPRLITNLESVNPGTSGAVTRLGLLGGLGGSIFIAIIGIAGKSISIILNGQTIVWNETLLFIFLVTLSGSVGMIIDSILGATVQVKYYCDQCEKMTEQNLHRGTHKTRIVGGIKWINNDVVNFSASVGAVVFCYLLLIVLGFWA